jgi:hypothetical protein
MDVQRLVETKGFSPDEVATKTGEIYDRALRESANLDAGNFTRIHPDDLERLFDLYDELFFEGGMRKLLRDTPLVFRLSKRMTQAAGKASCRELRDESGKVAHTEYGISVSTTLLFQTFKDEDRHIIMSGIACRDRLQALQRILEHEMVHLVEMLIWDQSSCSAPRFQSIANRFLGHTEHTHTLITPRERALTKYGIKAGDRVSFRLDGEHYMGTVNRITKRATVLVEDGQGECYSDGKRYAKFYVPVGMLEPAETAE